MTLGILAITAGLFFILPRTADAAFSRLISHRLHLPGFSNQVNLGEIGEIKTTSRPVMHIRLWGGQQGLKWRAGALTDFDGKRWSNPNPVKEPVRVWDGEAQLAPAGRPAGRQAPELRGQLRGDLDRTRCFSPACRKACCACACRTIYRGEGGGYRLGQVARRRASTTRPTACSKRCPRRAASAFPRRYCRSPIRERYLQLPILDRRIHELARRWTTAVRHRSRTRARHRTASALATTATRSNCRATRSPTRSRISCSIAARATASTSPPR